MHRSCTYLVVTVNYRLLAEFGRCQQSALGGWDIKGNRLVMIVVDDIDINHETTHIR